MRGTAGRARAAVACGCLALAACVSQPTNPPPPPITNAPRPSIEEQAARAEEASRPGPKHRALEMLVGEWDATSYELDPRGLESDPRTGHASLVWVLGGRFIEWRQTLELATGPRTTHGFLGYDEYQEEFQLLMVSDLATGMGVARGRGDLSGQGIRFVLDIADRRSGGVLRASSVLRSAGSSAFVLEQLAADASGTERVVRRTRFVRGRAKK